MPRAKTDLERQDLTQFNQYLQVSYWVGRHGAGSGGRGEVQNESVTQAQPCPLRIPGPEGGKDRRAAVQASCGTRGLGTEGSEEVDPWAEAGEGSAGGGHWAGCEENDKFLG